MAKQKGLLTLSGKMGNVDFYIRDGKAYAKQSARHVSQTENTQKSSSDFGTAGESRPLIRKGFRLLDVVSDRTMDNRLQKRLFAIINTGPKASQGINQITDGDVALLKGFEYNAFTSIQKLVHFSPTVVIDPAGEVVVSIPKMQTKDMFHAPRKASHVILQFCCCVFHFDIHNGRMSKPDELIISLDKGSFPGGHFTLHMEGTLNCVLALAWGVCFTTGDHQTVSFDRRYYAANILEAVNIVDGEIVVFQYPEPPAPVEPDDPQQHVQWVINEE